MDTDCPPSPLRLPVTAILIFVAPPLAPVAWILFSGSKRAAYCRSPWIRAGAAIFAAGTLPLLTVILLAAVRLWPDPDPNPVGLGLLFVAGAVLACVLLIIGIIRVETQRDG